jgi:hypothetical protein
MASQGLEVSRLDLTKLNFELVKYKESSDFMKHRRKYIQVPYQEKNCLSFYTDINIDNLAGAFFIFLIFLAIALALFALNYFCDGKFNYSTNIRVEDINNVKEVKKIKLLSELFISI